MKNKVVIRCLGVALVILEILMILNPGPKWVATVVKLTLVMCKSIQRRPQ